LRDIINAIYQHCLYEKKVKDEKKISDNVLDESLLVNLWTHILSTMGGSSVDINIARMTNITRFLARLLALLALGATIAGFIFAFLIKN
jgi:hypothetical protein